MGGTIDQLRAIVAGRISDTPQGAILQAIAASTPPGEGLQMKIELPAYALTDTDQGLGYKDYLAAHADLVPMIHEFAVNNLPATT